MTKGEDFIKHLAREVRIATTLAMKAIHLIAVPELGIRLIRNTEESITKELFTEHIEDLKKAPTFGYFYDLAQSLLTQTTEEEEEKKENNAVVPKGKRESLAKYIAKKRKE